MIDDDIERLWDRDDLCSSEDSVFIGTGVCSGRTRGVRKLEGGNYEVHSEIIEVQSKIHRFVDSVVEM